MMYIVFIARNYISIGIGYLMFRIYTSILLNFPQAFLLSDVAGLGYSRRGLRGRVRDSLE